MAAPPRPRTASRRHWPEAVSRRQPASTPRERCRAAAGRSARAQRPGAAGPCGAWILGPASALRPAPSSRRPKDIEPRGRPLPRPRPGEERAGRPRKKRGRYRAEDHNAAPATPPDGGKPGNARPRCGAGSRREIRIPDPISALHATPSSLLPQGAEPCGWASPGPVPERRQDLSVRAKSRVGIVRKATMRRRRRRRTAANRGTPGHGAVPGRGARFGFRIPFPRFMPRLPAFCHRAPSHAAGLLLGQCQSGCRTSVFARKARQVSCGRPQAPGTLPGSGRPGNARPRPRAAGPMRGSVFRSLPLSMRRLPAFCRRAPSHAAGLLPDQGRGGGKNSVFAQKARKVWRGRPQCGAGDAAGRRQARAHGRSGPVRGSVFRSLPRSMSRHAAGPFPGQRRGGGKNSVFAQKARQASPGRSQCRATDAAGRRRGGRGWRALLPARGRRAPPAPRPHGRGRRRWPAARRRWAWPPAAPPRRERRAPCPRRNGAPPPRGAGAPRRAADPPCRRGGGGRSRMLTRKVGQVLPESAEPTNPCQPAARSSDSRRLSSIHAAPSRPPSDEHRMGRPGGVPQLTRRRAPSGDAGRWGARPAACRCGGRPCPRSRSASRRRRRSPPPPAAP